MRAARTLYDLRQEAKAHNGEFKEALLWMKEPEDIENLRGKDELFVAVKHPYWKLPPEERALVRGMARVQMEVLRAILNPPEEAK